MRFASLAFVALLVVACSSTDDSDKVDETSQDLGGHCRVVCPKCHPGDVCPMYACIQDCSGPPARCVDNMMCPIGYTWSSSACSCLKN